MKREMAWLILLLLLPLPLLLMLLLLLLHLKGWRKAAGARVGGGG